LKKYLASVKQRILPLAFCAEQSRKCAQIFKNLRNVKLLHSDKNPASSAFNSCLPRYQYRMIIVRSFLFTLNPFQNPIEF
jgi:hypothetical protein